MAKRQRQPPAVGREGQAVLADGAIVDFVRRPFTAAEAGALTDALRTQVTWSQRQVKVYGKLHNEPRLQSYQVRVWATLCFALTASSRLRRCGGPARLVPAG